MSTFGTLKEASQKLSFPSTLTYKERIHLRDCDSVEYKRYASLFLSKHWFEMAQASSLGHHS